MTLKHNAIRTPALAAFALGEPILPIGYLPNGRPVFPIAGGAPDDPPDGDDKGKSGGADDFKPITTPEEMSKFLTERDLVINQRVSREREKYADYDDLKTKAAEYDKAIEAARTDQEKAVEAAKNEGRTEALTTANSRLVAAEARALAAEAKFRNPVLAVRAVDLKGVTVNDDGEVDAAAIKAKLKELSDADPYLLDDGKKPAPKPDKAQGGDAAVGDKSVASGRELFEARRAKKTTASQ
jgi:hypothetical protein